MNWEEAIVVAKNLLERRSALQHQIKVIDSELAKLSEKFTVIEPKERHLNDT